MYGMSMTPQMAAAPAPLRGPEAPGAEPADPRKKKSALDQLAPFLLGGLGGGALMGGGMGGLAGSGMLGLAGLLGGGGKGGGLPETGALGLAGLLGGKLG